MECICEPGEVDVPSDAWVVKWFKARKPHRCCECHETIPPGQRYERIFSACDGEARTFKTCEFCAKEYERLRAKHPDLSWLKGNDDLACLLVWDMRNEDRRANAN